jgi:predicted alpha/beta superfamily hydrolase
MRRHTASSNVHTLHTDFYIPQLKRHRTIYLYLPPDYYTSHKHYPVIYAQDGQNLFNEATAFHREWKIDKTLNQLHKKKDHGAIVVGIANGGGHRIHEYSAWHRPRLGGGEADRYVDFLADTLKPYIDTHFRTIASPDATALLGSSMGGLFALYGVLQRSDAFRRAGCLSPSLWFSHHIYEFAEKRVTPQHRLYLAGSQTESSFMRQALQNMYFALNRGGLHDAHLRVVLRDKGRHNEVFWRNEFKKTYQWLYN